MNKIKLVLGISALFALGVNNGYAQSKVHAVTDLSHEFTFYSDHRFHNQYLQGHKGETNWCSLFNFDLSNTNLLILPGCADEISYTKEDIATIKSFLNSGGGVVLMGIHQGKSQNKLAQVFGASFVDKAELPFVGSDASTQTSIEAKGGSYMKLDKPQSWNVLIKDAQSRPVMAVSNVGKGKLLVASRSLAGSNPNASDSINKDIWKPLLVNLASGKRVDSNKPTYSRGIDQLEYEEKRDAFVLRYNDYLKPYAGAMIDISERCMPVIEKRMGVPLSKGMGSEVALLATGGGGFSSGKTIALAVWWGDFPKKEDSMIEFITHESVHSWVLPFPEVWNEPIATYVGNLVMCDMEHGEEGLRRIQSTIDRARKHDPKMTCYDLDGKATNGGTTLSDGAKNDIHWGKSYFVLEELRKQDPDFIAKYFQAKRKYATGCTISEYGIHNTVLLLSHVMQKDLFEWFNSLGIQADRSKATIRI